MLRACGAFAVSGPQCGPNVRPMLSLMMLHPRSLPSFQEQESLDVSCQIRCGMVLRRLDFELVCHVVDGLSVISTDKALGL